MGLDGESVVKKLDFIYRQLTEYLWAGSTVTRAELYVLQQLFSPGMEKSVQKTGWLGLGMILLRKT